MLSFIIIRHEYFGVDMKNQALSKTLEFIVKTFMIIGVHFGVSPGLVFNSYVQRKKYYLKEQKETSEVYVFL